MLSHTQTHNVQSSVTFFSQSATVIESKRQSIGIIDWTAEATSFSPSHEQWLKLPLEHEQNIINLRMKRVKSLPLTCQQIAKLLFIQFTMMEGEILKALNFVKL